MYKCATLRVAQGKLRRYCYILKRTLNGASHQMLIVLLKLGS